MATNMVSYMRNMFCEAKEFLVDDQKRYRMQFIWINVILSAISGGMTLINIFTKKYVLMWATLIFAFLCVGNVAIVCAVKKGMGRARILFAVEIVALFLFFIVSGTPEGFSAIWICLLPACGMLLYGRRDGSIICFVMLVILIFFFWMSAGRAFLQYQYTDSFMLRFPLLYCAFWAVSYFLETIRYATHEQLAVMERKYSYRYRHDALTGVLNRYGFNEKMQQVIGGKKEKGFSMAIIDIDFFKKVNDRYGHFVGDIVLKKTAEILQGIVGERGELCRWGGEEFAVFLNVGQGAGSLAEEICRIVANTPIEVEENRISITVSLGVTIVPPGRSIDAQELVKQTDQRLYKAKELGRNRAVIREYMG